MEKFVSDMLKQRRLEANLSQEQVAERVNADVRTVRRIENNEVKRKEQEVKTKLVEREIRK